MRLAELSIQLHRDSALLYSLMVDMAGIPRKGGYFVCSRRRAPTCPLAAIYLGENREDSSRCHDALYQTIQGTNFTSPFIVHRIDGTFQRIPVIFFFSGHSREENLAICLYIAQKMQVKLDHNSRIAAKENPFLHLMRRYDEHEHVLIYTSEEEKSPLRQPPKSLPFSYRYICYNTPEGGEWVDNQGWHRAPRAALFNKNGLRVHTLNEGPIESWKGFDKLMKQLGYTEFNS